MRARAENIQDRELIRRFLAGDREAFGAVYHAHSAAVFRFALHMTADSVVASEITQDVFVWLIHHAADFDPARGELGAFLNGVTKKFLQRRHCDERRWLPLDESPIAFTAAPAGRDEEHCDTERLRQAIARLPERYREVVVLCDLEAHSYEKAAAMLGCAIGTVRSRLHRARALLARKLQAPEREMMRCSL